MFFCKTNLIKKISKNRWPSADKFASQPETSKQETIKGTISLTDNSKLLPDKEDSENNNSWFLENIFYILFQVLNK